MTNGNWYAQKVFQFGHGHWTDLLRKSREQRMGELAARGAYGISSGGSFLPFFRRRR